MNRPLSPGVAGYRKRDAIIVAVYVGPETRADWNEHADGLHPLSYVSHILLLSQTVMPLLRITQSHDLARSQSANAARACGSASPICAPHAVT